MMSKAEVAALQRDLNHFTNKHLYKVTPLIVDGVYGKATRKRIRQCKFWLGLHAPYQGTVNAHFRARLEHPLWGKRNFKWERLIGIRRRLAHRRAVKRNERKARNATGIRNYDGHPVAAWIVPYLNWARYNRVNGRVWVGGLNSGYRTPEYSESLCRNMCGAPTCLGRCAGRGSGHSQQVKPGGCVDVSDYVHFREAMRACPYTPRLINDLPIDPVHFSVSGH